MTIHDFRATRAAKEAKPVCQRPHHPLAGFDTENLAKRIVIFTPSGSQIRSLVSLARKSISGLTTPADVVCKVMTHNPDSICAISRRSRYDSSDSVAEGFFA